MAVLELGTNSLKLHVYRPDEDRFLSFKREWEAGYNIWSAGSLSEAGIDAILADVRELLDEQGLGDREDLFGVATGALAEVENNIILVQRLDRECSIPIRILTGNEEANLLIHGFTEFLDKRPSVILDLGGGRLRTVVVGETWNLTEMLALGVIQVQQVGAFASSDWQEETAERYILEQLRNAHRGPFLSDVYATGGTIKAISQVAGTPNLSLEVLDQVETDVRRNGVPDYLSERRRGIFLPGLLVIKHVLAHVGGERLHYHHFRLGETLMEHLRPFYKTFGGKLRRAFIDREFELFS
jgi:exopolyphosphatase/pppGpp-phosphohydrolase